MENPEATFPPISIAIQASHSQYEYWRQVWEKDIRFKVNQVDFQGAPGRPDGLGVVRIALAEVMPGED